MLSFSLPLLFTFVVFCLYETHSTNLTFVPKPIRINIADLPPPFATPNVDRTAIVDPVPSDPHLSTPNGFSIKLYMSGLEEPRFIYTPNDEILVSESNASRISCLLDTDKDGFPDQRVTFGDASNGLDEPHGMAFFQGFFYVGNRCDIRRYQWNPNNCSISGNGTRVMTYQTSSHERRTIAITPFNDKIYVTIGSDSDDGPEHPPLASVLRADIDGNNIKLFASGIRNPSGITIHPITQDIYITCMERNKLGDDLVPDFFTRIQKGDFFG